MSKTYTNSGKSVKERLLNLSRAEHYKCGALIYAHERFEARPTLDIDFMATRINNDKVSFMIKAFRQYS